jgi:hypothetical protein
MGAYGYSIEFGAQCFVSDLPGLIMGGDTSDALTNVIARKIGL